MSKAYEECEEKGKRRREERRFWGFGGSEEFGVALRLLPPAHK